jgi:hypothetical protein
MTTINEYTDLHMPDWSLCYLVNGDEGDLSDVEIETVNDFMAEYYAEAKKVGGHVIFSTTEEHDEFSIYPEFGAACAVTTCTILIVK